MDRRVLASASLLVLVALSGCSILGFGNANVTVQEPPDRERPSATPTTPELSEPGFPRGTNSDRIVRPRLLVRGHVSTMATRSYTIDLEVSSQSGANQTARSLAAASAYQRGTFRSLAERPQQRAAQYWQDGTLYVRSEQGGQTEYRVREIDGGFEQLHQRGLAARELVPLFEVANYTYAETVERNGTELHRYTLAETVFEQADGNVTVEETSGEVLVTREGIIRVASVEIRGQQSGESFVLLIDYRLTPETAPIEEPDWLDAARQNRTDASG